MRSSGAHAALALGLALPLPPARAAAAVDPLVLLDAALSSPEISYRGKVAVTRWFGRQTRFEEFNVYFSPPSRYRWEFLSPSETVVRTVVSDGQTELLRTPKKALRGDSLRAYEKLLTAEDERALLLRNYELRLAGSDSVAGRRAEVLELKPRDDDRPRQKLWIDAQTRVILENKRFRPRGPAAAAMRFSRFETVPAHPDELFSTAPSSAASQPHGLDPDMMSLAELRQATGGGFPFPQELPGGFAFESANFFDARGRTVRHVRYTDGLAVVSIFETDRPVKLSASTGEPLEPLGRGRLRLASAGKVLHFKSRRGSYLTLIGDVSGRLLETIAARLKQPS